MSEATLTEALARSLREIMQANGRPSVNEYHRRERSLFEEHIAQWERARSALAWFEREQAETQGTPADALRALTGSIKAME